ncbi:adhesion G protein-coupled receptor E3-like isoform X1 [Ostrea edulis]|uniref:adhesion G protein-coupled receptor E3-like isoform X1 n=1 Tax=Ostrea edulis TaxID=37623 RepID=UPI0024AFC3E5|nr:adhesion G protein-coupled receptor E3-like isoform X1 [Ostrea edulis]
MKYFISLKHSGVTRMWGIMLFIAGALVVSSTGYIRQDIISTHEGDTLPITATVRGRLNASIHITWFRNGRKIPNNTRFNYQISRYEAGNKTVIRSDLEVTKVKLIDAGNWTITAKNGNETVSKTTFVKVYKKPVLKAKRITVLVREGSSIFLVCYWTDNGHEKYFPEILLRSKTGTPLRNWISTRTTDNSYAVFLKSESAILDKGLYHCYNNRTDGVFSKQSKEIDVQIYTADAVVCPTSLDDKGISWTSAFNGTTEYGACPPGSTGYSSRFCDITGKWNTTDTSYCSNEEFDSISNELDNLDSEIADVMLDDDDVDKAINNTLKKIEMATLNDTTAGDLNRTMRILERVIGLTNFSSGIINDQSFFGTVDNVLSTRNTGAWTRLSQTANASDAGTVMSLVDRFSVYARQKRRNSRMANTFNGTNFDVQFDDINSEDNIAFPEVGPKKSFLVFPRQSQNQTGNFYAAVIYRTIASVLPSNIRNVSKVNMTRKSTFVNTPVLSFTLDNAPDVLSPPLTLTFKTIKSTTDSSSAMCVYWDFLARGGRGAWHTDGCQRIESTSNQIICQCNHLTNFAVLMSLKSNVADSAVLSQISLIGSCVSVVFASVTVMMHMIVWRNMKSDVTILLMNLCVALAISYVLFIGGTEASSNEVVCKVTTFFLHSMLLVMFSMMQCIGIYYFRNVFLASIWLRLADQFSRRSSLPWFLVLGWAIPFIISTVTIGIYVNKTYHISNYCWLSAESGSLYFFVVPVCLVVFNNVIIILTLLKVSLSRMKQNPAQIAQNTEKPNIVAKARSALKNLGTLVPALGITWAFGIMSMNDTTEVFQYLFTISSSLQGFFIFLVHVPLNKKLRDAYKKKFKFIESISSSQKTTVSTERTTNSSPEVSKIPKRRKMHQDAAEDGVVRFSKIVRDWNPSS